jgi:hypothetical protein
VAGAELGHHVAAVDLDRARADRQPARDLLVRAARAEQLEHLALAAAEQRDGELRLDLTAAAFGILARFGKDGVEAAREAAHLERQQQVVEHAGLDRGHDLLGARLLRGEHHREPDAAFAEPADQVGRHAGIAGVGGDDDPLMRRMGEQLVELA